MNESALSGVQGKTLKKLESRLGVSLALRGDQLLVDGDARPGRFRQELLRAPPPARREGPPAPRGGPPDRPGHGRRGIARLPGRLRAGRAPDPVPEVGHPQEPQPAGLPPGHQDPRPRLRHRPGGHGQDLPGHGHGPGLPPEQSSSTASSSPARRSRRARSSASCPGTSSRRSTPTSGPSTTPCSTSPSTTRPTA